MEIQHRFLKNDRAMRGHDEDSLSPSSAPLAGVQDGREQRNTTLVVADQVARIGYLIAIEPRAGDRSVYVGELQQSMNALAVQVASEHFPSIQVNIPTTVDGVITTSKLMKYRTDSQRLELF
jgi:hypothetical protein